MGAYFLKKQARSPILEGFGRNIYALLSFSGQQYKTKKPATEINVQQILVLHTKSAGFLPIFINVETFHIKPHYMRIFSIFYTIGEILTS